MPRRALAPPPPPAADRPRTRLMPMRILAVVLGGFLAFVYAPSSPLAKAMPQGAGGWPCKALHVNCDAPAKPKPAHRPAPHRTPEKRP